jgi:hypothetical protein
MDTELDFGRADPQSGQIPLMAVEGLRATCSSVGYFGIETPLTNLLGLFFKHGHLKMIILGLVRLVGAGTVGIFLAWIGWT